MIAIAVAGLSPHPGAAGRMTLRSSGDQGCLPAGPQRKSRNRSETRVLAHGAVPRPVPGRAEDERGHGKAPRPVGTASLGDGLQPLLSPSVLLGFIRGLGTGWAAGGNRRASGIRDQAGCSYGAHWQQARARRDPQQGVQLCGRLQRAAVEVRGDTEGLWGARERRALFSPWARLRTTAWPLQGGADLPGQWGVTSVKRTSGGRRGSDVEMVAEVGYPAFAGGVPECGEEAGAGEGGGFSQSGRVTPPPPKAKCGGRVGSPQGPLFPLPSATRPSAPGEELGAQHVPRCGCH